MGVTSYTLEFTCSIPPSQFFKLQLDAHNLYPKLVPQMMKKIEVIEGGDGVGGIRLTSLGEGGKYKYMKHRVDAIDASKHYFKHTMIESDFLDDFGLESLEQEFKVEASGAGSLFKVINTYHTKGDAVLTEDFIKTSKEQTTKIYKVAEDYLSANPNAYA